MLFVIKLGLIDIARQVRPSIICFVFHTVWLAISRHLSVSVSDCQYVSLSHSLTLTLTRSPILSSCFSLNTCDCDYVCFHFAAAVHDPFKDLYEHRTVSEDYLREGIYDRIINTVNVSLES